VHFLVLCGVDGLRRLGEGVRGTENRCGSKSGVTCGVIRGVVMLRAVLRFTLFSPFYAFDILDRPLIGVLLLLARTAGYE